MTSSPLQPGQLGGHDPIHGAQSAQGKAQGDPSKKTDGAAFRALLERLQARTAEIEETSRTLDDPADLPGAVDVARASLDDAVSLSDRLLEAFREAQVQPDANAKGE